MIYTMNTMIKKTTQTEFYLELYTYLFSMPLKKVRNRILTFLIIIIAFSLHRKLPLENLV